MKYLLSRPPSVARHVRLLRDGELLNELKTLPDHGIQSGDTLEYVWSAEPSAFCINLPIGLPHNVDTIDDVKAYIQTKTGIPADLQILNMDEHDANNNQVRCLDRQCNIVATICFSSGEAEFTGLSV